MSDNGRFREFSQIITKEFPDRKRSIADIAGGKGKLAFVLRRDFGYNNVTTFDKEKRRIRMKGVNYRHKEFIPRDGKRFDLLVGLHPDEATDLIIYTAGKWKVPFIVCPCCPKPNVTNVSEKVSLNYNGWVRHLETFAQRCGFYTRKRKIDIDGKNIVLIGLPK